MSDKDLKRVREHLRKVWSWTFPWRLAHKRAHSHGDGFPRCENKGCPHKGKAVPKVFIDHIEPLGRLDTKSNPLFRLLVPSSKLQAWCKECHQKKTNNERKVREGKKLKFTDTF